MLGGALVIYGGVLVAGHKPPREGTVHEFAACVKLAPYFKAHAGQAERWRRVAVVSLHGSRPQSSGKNNHIEDQATQHPGEDATADMQKESRHAAAKAKKVFERIISIEELPRQHGTIGSLTDHLQSRDGKQVSEQASTPPQLTAAAVVSPAQASRV